MTINFHLSEFRCPCCGLGDDIVSQDLINALQNVRDNWGREMVVNSGYRCAKHNSDIGGAPGSAHLTGQAADIKDPNGELKAWISLQLDKFGLWMEAPHYTSTWCHLQIRPAYSRVFKP